jgi:hypothetical protein
LPSDGKVSSDLVNRGPKGGYNVNKKIHASSANFNENHNKNIKTMN